MSGTAPNNNSATTPTRQRLHDASMQGQRELKRRLFPPGTAYDEHPYLEHDLKVVQDMIRLREHAFAQGAEELETLRRLEWAMRLHLDAEMHAPQQSARMGGGAE